MSPLPFAKSIRWFFMRFFSEKQLRLWFEKKSGGENEMFQYKADLSNCKKVIMFLPVELDKLFVILPLAIELSEKRKQDDFLILTDESNRHILRALNLERLSLFYNSQIMLYGEAYFFEIEKRVKEQKWDLCLFLQENASLPYLYLAKATRAVYRIGIKPEFPFLNIALQSYPNNSNVYANRNYLYKAFLINPEKAGKDGIHATQKNEKQSFTPKLSTSNAILLNLEPPINGEPWTESEIFMVCKSFRPEWRLIAIAATNKQFEPYSKVMEELEIRSNPVLLHSESIFSVLRQYPAIITLNSMHSHLFLNLSNIKMIMLEQSADRETPNSQNMMKFSREGNFYSLAKLATEFISSKQKDPVAK
jgi:hypothetical protein